MICVKIRTQSFNPSHISAAELRRFKIDYQLFQRWLKSNGFRSGLQFKWYRNFQSNRWRSAGAPVKKSEWVRSWKRWLISVDIFFDGECIRRRRSCAVCAGGISSIIISWPTREKKSRRRSQTEKNEFGVLCSVEDPAKKSKWNSRRKRQTDTHYQLQSA